MRKFLFLIVFALPFLHAEGQVSVAGSRAMVQSPDNNLKVEFRQRNIGNSREMVYSVSYRHKEVIKESVLDIQLDNHLSESAMALKVDRHEKWVGNLQVKNIIYATKDTSWKPVHGEKAEIRDHFNLVTIHLTK